MNYTDLTQFYMGFYKTTPTEETTGMVQITIKEWLERDPAIVMISEGRIIDNGVNFIVTGFAPKPNSKDGELIWSSIPCHNLGTARLYLQRVMPEDEFKGFLKQVERWGADGWWEA
jgi:hypothetical protein